MRNATLLLACLLSANARAACDPDTAKEMLQGIGSFGTWTEQKQAVDFRWRPEPHEMAPVARAAVMKEFARSYRCLHDKAREVSFYLDGKLVARSLADGTFKPARAEFDLPDGPQVNAWLDVRTR